MLLVVAAAVALAGVALAGKGSKPVRPQPAPRVHVSQSSEPRSESGSEQEAGQSGEPAQGHEDPPGQDVNHECTGDCQE